MLPQGSSFTTRPQLAGTFGMIASTHWLATASGMAVLEAGGTAFDAAVAAGLVLQVVEPHMNGLGGEAPVIGYDAGNVDPSSTGVFVLDGQGPAPGRATLDAFGALDLDLVPGNGLLPACVPAAFGTWMLLLERHGRMRLRDVMQYAIGYARDGYPMTAGVSAGIAAAEPVFREHWPSSAEIYLAGGVPATGSRFANPDLAATYQRILDEAEAAGADRDVQIEAARRAFYEGFVADAAGAYLAAAEVMDVTGERHRALLGPADLAGWRASAEEPVTLDFAGLTVCKTGPWGQGPVFLQQLALLDGLGVAEMDPAGPDFVHTVVESAKLAFADREAWYGDPRFAAVPLGDLLSQSYATKRRSLVGPSASPDLRPGDPGGAEPRLPGYATGEVRVPGGMASAEPTAEESGAAARPAWEVTGQGTRADPEAEPGGHLPPGRRRPVREHGVGHAERGLAAEFAGHPRPRFLPGHPGPDVHPHPGPAQQPRPGQAPADHADPEPGAARRGAVPGLRHAGRGPAGPVDAGLLPAACAVRDEPAGGDRRARVPHPALPVVVLPARIIAAGGRCGGTGRGRGAG